MFVWNASLPSFANSVTALITGLTYFVDAHDKLWIEMDLTVIHQVLLGNIETKYKGMSVAQKIHINKTVFYIFYVYELSRLILHRRASGVPVCWIKLAEEVLTAVRWTLSPSA